jgi:hypothetical protein
MQADFEEYEIECEKIRHPMANVDAPDFNRVWHCAT